MRDTIINFGDDLRADIMDRATAEARGARVLLSLGSTMLVSPANELVTLGGRGLRTRRRYNEFRAHDRAGTTQDPLPPVPDEHHLIIVNRQKTEFDDRAIVRVFGDTDVFFDKLARHLVGDDAFCTWLTITGRKRVAYDAKRREQPPSVRSEKAKAARLLRRTGTKRGKRKGGVACLSASARAPAAQRSKRGRHGDATTLH